jgi:predicted nucleic acid-binding protein
VSSGPPRRGLIDTPIVVEIRAGQPDDHLFAVDLLRSVGIEMSELSATILLSLCRVSADLQCEMGFLGNCRIHPITARISHRAFRILESLPPPCGFSADDAIIAATAIEHKLPLYTLDSARFAAVPGLTAIKPY